MVRGADTAPHALNELSTDLLMRLQEELLCVRERCTPALAFRQAAWVQIHLMNTILAWGLQSWWASVEGI